MDNTILKAPIVVRGKTANEFAVDEKIYLKNLKSGLLEKLYIEKDDSVLLNELTDEQLAELGVPEKGDVMTFNGQVCFRNYVAILDNYFDVENKKIEIKYYS